MRVAASPLGRNDDLGPAARAYDVRQAPQGGRIHLAALQRIPARDLEGQPQPARQLRCRSCWRHGTASGRWPTGLKRQGEILKSLGVEPGTVSFGGGAGGDRSDLATPRATVTLLRAMAARPEFAAYDPRCRSWAATARSPRRSPATALPAATPTPRPGLTSWRTIWMARRS